jgi:hypothetical protein
VGGEKRPVVKEIGCEKGGKKAVTFLKKSNQKTFAELDRAGETTRGPV